MAGFRSFVLAACVVPAAGQALHEHVLNALGVGGGGGDYGEVPDYKFAAYDEDGRGIPLPATEQHGVPESLPCAEPDPFLAAGKHWH